MRQNVRMTNARVPAALLDALAVGQTPRVEGGYLIGEGVKASGARFAVVLRDDDTVERRPVIGAPVVWPKVIGELTSPEESA